jgi:hypothetical protein
VVLESRSLSRIFESEMDDVTEGKEDVLRGAR